MGDTGARITGNAEVEPPNARGPEVGFWEVANETSLAADGQFRTDPFGQETRNNQTFGRCSTDQQSRNERERFDR